MNDITFEDSGMEEFHDMLGSYLSKVDEKSALDAIEEGAKEFVNDLLRLPKPRRKVTAPGYTHLVDSFSYKRDKTGIDVGWGKYYGPMLDGVFPEEGAALAIREMALLKERHNMTMDFVHRHPEAAVSYDEVSYLFGDGSMSPYTAGEIAGFVSILEPYWKGTESFAALQEAAENASRLAVGEKYVDAEFYDLDGNRVLLSSLVPEGRITMLEFWASWCGPCRGEIPHLKHIHTRYPEFDIISISLDDNADDWKKAVKEENMDWVQLKDVSLMDGNAMKLYGVMGIPCCIILDEQGRFFKTDMRGPYLDAFLRNYYGR